VLTIGIFAVVLVVVGYAIVTYNTLVRARIRVREAWSGIDVQLRRRASLLPNVMKTVEAYATHERGTFAAITQARAALQQAGGAADAARASDALSYALGRLFAVAENYPELRASENFRSLQAELSDVEEKIAYARQFYNRNVLDYNARIEVFPGVVISRMFTFTAAEFFEDEAGRAEVEMTFGQTAPATGTASPPSA
jgi:LemA protein